MDSIYDRIVGEPPVMWWLGSHYRDTERNRKVVDKLVNPDAAYEGYDEWGKDVKGLKMVWMYPTSDGWWNTCDKEHPRSIKATRIEYE